MSCKRPLVLVSRSGKRFIIHPGQGMMEVPGLGVVDTSRLTECAGTFQLAGMVFTVMEASILDILTCMKRGAQIITVKDSAQIVLHCCIGPGSKVLEVGTGSAHLTVVLAHAAGNQGSIVTYEMNPKHAKVARANIALAGMDATVELRESDATSCTDQGKYDAAVMDMPEPWAILPQMKAALRPGGYLCAYVPTMNQAEAAVKAMRDHGFMDIHAMENIQREIVVGDGGTRPSFEMLGHTGYLCFGRKGLH